MESKSEVSQESNITGNIENAKSKTKRKKSKVKPFYNRDGDDAIAWGPVTLNEIKDRLVAPVRLKPEKRHSIFGTAKISPEASKMEYSIPDISEYLTASEHSKIVENSYGASIYLPSIDKNNTESECTSVYLPGIEPNSTDKSSVYLSMNDLDISKQNLIDTNTSCLNFLQRALYSSVDGIKNESQSLINLTEDSLNESVTSSVSLSKDDPAILISSDDEDKESYELPNKFKRLSCVVEESNEKNSNSTERSGKDNVTNIPFICVNDIAQRDSVYQRGSISPTSIPEIDLDQFNDTTDDGFFNNTFDKIDALLKQTEDLSITDSLNESKRETTLDDKNYNEDDDDAHEENYNSHENSDKVINIISASFLHKPEANLSDHEKNKTPQKNSNTPKISQLRTKTPTKLAGEATGSKFTPTSLKSKPPFGKKSPEVFRVPEFPNKLKVNKSKVKLDNIVSPVRMYIKYSPKPVIKRHCVEKPHGTLKTSPRIVEPKKKDKENISEIPKVLYKPSKTPMLASEEDIQLPNSVSKMIMKSDYTKHAKPATSRTKLFNNESLDPEADLTTSFQNDSSSLSQSNDISIWHKKTAFRD